MASSQAFQDILAKASTHFNDVRPFLPMYLHLIISALFPIYTGAHASLSCPSSAAKQDKKRRKAGTTDEDDEEEEEDKIQKMEGMSNTDAIVLPVVAGITLAGLYWAINKYGADLINLILGWYFSAVGVYSVGQLVNDCLNLMVGFVFPTYYAQKGVLWKVSTVHQEARKQDESAQAKDTPLPSFLNAIPLPAALKTTLWTLRRLSKQKYTLKAYFQHILDLRANLTIINALSASLGLWTIIYVNTVSKPWFLTNLQGFAVSYSALQIMSPTTFGTGSLILSALFCYDIWAVFFTPLMVTVAKNLDQPIKLVFPRPDEPPAAPGEPPVKSFSMLGLGDIVLPGIMIGLALRFDLYLHYLRKQTKSEKRATRSSGDVVVEKAEFVSPTGRWGDYFWTSPLPKTALPDQLRSSFSKPYFTASMIGYVLGMMMTLGVMSIFNHAQPALLYLVPGVLVSLWGTALIRGEVKEMWEFSEAITGEQMDDNDEEAKKDDVKEQKPNGLFDRLWYEIWSSPKDEKKVSEAKEESIDTASKKGKKSEKADDSKSTKSEDLSDDTVFHLSIRRLGTRHTKAKTSSKNTGGSAEEPHETITANGDANGSATPRRRTRSTRSSS